MSALEYIGRVVQAPERKRLGVVVDAWFDGKGVPIARVLWEPIVERQTSDHTWLTLRAASE